MSPDRNSAPETRPISGADSASLEGNVGYVEEALHGYLNSLGFRCFMGRPRETQRGAWLLSVRSAARRNTGPSSPEGSNGEVFLYV
jgi:hypothetical protein